MRCPSCNAENQPTAKFCVECGTAFQTPCVNCGFKNPPAARFCQECGVGLNAPVQAPIPETSPVQPREVAGERRHLTVLFCDLVGSTAIAAQLDPEEWRETVAGYQRAAAEAITRFGGHVAKYLGDGVMAFFGYPEAHDDDAERAARAGLAIIDAIAKLNEQPGRSKLAARVGIDSGAVVVGAGAGKDADVFGDAPNIAARVQEAAAPGTVLVTEDTHRLISGLFVVESRGAPALKGVERPVQLYRVIQPHGITVYGQQERSTYNGHFESTCFLPLLLFNRQGDCLAAKTAARQRAQRRGLGRTAAAGDRAPTAAGQGGGVSCRCRLRQAGALRGPGRTG